jgi:hypothetical protein
MEHAFDTLAHTGFGTLHPRKPSESTLTLEEPTMNAFTAHPHRQGITYVEHWCFAMGIAYRLFTSVMAFALHGLLPFIPIEPRLDLESTAAYLAERNRWIETAKGRGQRDAKPRFAVVS